MIRTELREHVFKMLFQIEFNDAADMPDHLKYYFETLDDASNKDKEYIQKNMRQLFPECRRLMGFSTRLLQDGKHPEWEKLI